MERTIRVLNDMEKASVVREFVLGGAVAALFYIEPIETHDLDVFITLPEPEGPLLSLEGIYQYLSGRGYVASDEHVIIEGVPVQFLVPSTSLIDDAMKRAARRKYGDETLKVMDAEHLLAVMVQLNRPKDRIRIALFLDQASIDRARFLDILKKHDLEEQWHRITAEIGRGFG